MGLSESVFWATVTCIWLQTISYSLWDASYVFFCVSTTTKRIYTWQPPSESPPPLRTDHPLPGATLEKDWVTKTPHFYPSQDLSWGIILAPGYLSVGNTACPISTLPFPQASYPLVKHIYPESSSAPTSWKRHINHFAAFLRQKLGQGLFSKLVEYKNEI